MMIHPFECVDLAPAKWIWFPSERTLTNTFVLFRKTFDLSVVPDQLPVQITADSRYLLYVNGRRVEWGPAPSDPRHLEVDEMDIAGYLQTGRNVVAAHVLFYGHPEGTWVMGSAGFIARIKGKDPAGKCIDLSTDSTWTCCLDRAHKPGQFKKNFLRSLQEDFDARLFPYGWNEVEFDEGAAWSAAFELPEASSCRPPICSKYGDYLHHPIVPHPEQMSLYLRQTPRLEQENLSISGIVDSGRMVWKQNRNDWFEYRRPGSYEVIDADVLDSSGGYQPFPLRIKAEAEQDAGVFVTFDFLRQVVGWPYFEIEAPAGTVVYMMHQEGHLLKNRWLDTHYYSWSKWICKEGVNRFENYDYESLKWLQLYIEQPSGRSCDKAVTLCDVGVRMRNYPWRETRLLSDSFALNRVFEACANTVYNAAQETVVDGMGRERQQYSGDGGHIHHILRGTFGAEDMSRRFLITYGMGQRPDGKFHASWPGCDRLIRSMQTFLGFTVWGGLIDHSVGFVFDNYHHYIESGDLELLRFQFPKLEKFSVYLDHCARENGLLSVEDENGNPMVWMDHWSYAVQQHRRCAFNLYVAAMYRMAMREMALALGETEKAVGYAKKGDVLLRETQRQFWCAEEKTYVVNLPWLGDGRAENTDRRYCDRSLGMALIYDLCPDADVDASLKILEEIAFPGNARTYTPQDRPFKPMSYPPNAIWRYWALARHGRINVVLDEFEQVWAQMHSVVYNRCCQERWDAKPDTLNQFSHLSIAPLIILQQEIVGLRPRKAGCQDVIFTPQLGRLKTLDVWFQTAAGEYQFKYSPSGRSGGRIEIKAPPGAKVELDTKYLVEKPEIIIR